MEEIIEKYGLDAIARRADGSYVVTRHGLPYHVPNEGVFVPDWAEIDAYAQAHPDIVTEEAAPEIPFAALVVAKRAEIWGAGDAILAAAKARYSQAEVESWPKQEQGARDIDAGQTETEAALFVAAIAAQRGIDLSTLVGKILANAEAYAALSAAVIGEQQRLDELIKAAEAAQDKDALAAIVWTYAPEEGEAE